MRFTKLGTYVFKSEFDMKTYGLIGNPVIGQKARASFFLGRGRLFRSLFWPYLWDRALRPSTSVIISELIPFSASHSLLICRSKGRQLKHKYGIQLAKSVIGLSRPLTIAALLEPYLYTILPNTQRKWIT